MVKDRDTALVRDCRNGDRHALQLLVSRYERPIFNAAYRMLGNMDDAADATQTAFLKVFEHLDSYDPKYRFFSWIYRIVINESINLLTKRKRQEGSEIEIESAERGPEDLAESEKLCRCVQLALLGLQEDYRAVIVLRHFSECSYQEIGEILHIPEKTVKSRLYSARQQLQGKLSESGII